MHALPKLALASLFVLGTAAGQSQHVLLIGIDGARSDAVLAASTPNLDALAATGAVTWNARTGGALDPSAASHQDTSSGPGWSSMLTGVWSDLHDVKDNGDFASGKFNKYPHLFSHVRDTLPGAYLSSIVQWHPINENLLDPYPGLADFTQEVADSGSAVANAAVAHLASADPNVLFLHFDDVDHAGHGGGFHPTNSAYLAAITQTDLHIGAVLGAVAARPNFANEDWVVIVSTDHGGSGTSHGGHTPSERTVWILASGGGVGNESLECAVGHTVVTRTVLEHLGVPIDPGWELADEHPFGIPHAAASEPRPADGSAQRSLGSILDWLAGADATSHEVYFGTSPAPPWAASVTGSSFDPGPLAPRTTYFWRVDTVSPSGTQAGPEWSFSTRGTLYDELVLHLPFEEDAVDGTGQGLDAAVFGNPNYLDGTLGSAIRFDGNGDYASFGSPAELDFGEDQDFSVAFWVRSNGWSSDPVIIGNKNWSSGDNVGWLIAGESDGTSWQWNFRGAGGYRLDYDLVFPIADLQWHHVCGSHDRDGEAAFYQDGAPIGSIELDGQGDIDGALATALAQDGTLTYANEYAGRVDELRLWRRTLGPEEVLELAQAPRRSIGERYCDGLVNSSGVGARVQGEGSDVVADNDFTLAAVGVPPGTFGIFYFGADEASVPFGNGLRCVGGAVWRYVPAVKTSTAGVALLPVDLDLPPSAGRILAGSRWHFQFWFRDAPAGGAKFNLSDALRIDWL